MNITRIGTVHQCHHEFGPLPQTLEESDHQVPDVLGVVGRERVLVSFDGGESKTLALEFAPPGRATCIKHMPNRVKFYMSYHFNTASKVIKENGRMSVEFFWKSLHTGEQKC